MRHLFRVLLPAGHPGAEQAGQEVVSALQAGEGCRMTDRELKRLLDGVAHDAGAQLVAIETTGGSHRRITFDNGVVLFVGSTISDHGARQNIRAQARRLLRGGR
jgi:hypothetical protein